MIPKQLRWRDFDILVSFSSRSHKMIVDTVCNNSATHKSVSRNLYLWTTQRMIEDRCFEAWLFDPVRLTEAKIFMRTRAKAFFTLACFFLQCGSIKGFAIHMRGTPAAPRSPGESVTRKEALSVLLLAGAGQVGALTLLRPSRPYDMYRTDATGSFQVIRSPWVSVMERLILT